MRFGSTTTLPRGVTPAASVTTTDRLVFIKKVYNLLAMSMGTAAIGAYYDAQLQNLEEKLQHLLQTRVKIKYHKGKGQIQIDYFSLEEFDRLYDILISS